jgi:hypothetical protein
MGREEEFASRLNEAQSQAAQPIAPLDASARAERLIDEFTGESDLSPEASAKLRSLVQAAIQERHEEITDLRIGRVLAATIAQL